MALTKGTNSYVTVVEANAYFADRLDVAAWTDSDDTGKAQALVSATDILDDLPWVGTSTSSTQDLAFPRSGHYFDPRVGATVSLSGTPERITSATMELAYHLLNNDGLQDNTGRVKDLDIGAIKLGTILPADLIPLKVKRMIRPILVNHGSSSWWRAN